MQSRSVAEELAECRMCPRCKELRWIKEFRVLNLKSKPSARYAYCHDCELDYEAERKRGFSRLA